MGKTVSLTMIAGLVLLVAGALLAPDARADRRGDHPRRFDPPGHSIRHLPSGHNQVIVRSRPYYYHSGVYYEPFNAGYRVVRAPIGARVSRLPAGYVSFGIGTRRYFHVNATYYLFDERNRDYVVVEAPEGAEEALKEGEQIASLNVFVYPRNGQSEAMRDEDRYECHLWAKSQTGFDPSLGEPDAGKAPDYRRALTACLEGRGYTVR